MTDEEYKGLLEELSKEFWSVKYRPHNDDIWRRIEELLDFGYKTGKMQRLISKGEI